MLEEPTCIQEVESCWQTLTGSGCWRQEKNKRDVASHIKKCRARETRKQIQHRDELIQQNHPTRFKSFKKPGAECTRLLSQTGNSVITDTQELLKCWADLFQSWANPNLTLILSSKRVTNPQMNTTSSYGKQNNILDCELSVEEIEYAINHLKRGRAAWWCWQCLSWALKFSGPIFRN